MTKTELLQIISSQQETIANLTKLLESEKRKVLIAPVDWDTMKYAEILKPTCGYQPLAGSGYELGNPPKQE